MAISSDDDAAAQIARLKAEIAELEARESAKDPIPLRALACWGGMQQIGLRLP